MVNKLKIAATCSSSITFLRTVVMPLFCFSHTSSLKHAYMPSQPPQGTIKRDKQFVGNPNFCS